MLNVSCIEKSPESQQLCHRLWLEDLHYNQLLWLTTNALNNRLLLSAYIFFYYTWGNTMSTDRVNGWHGGLITTKSGFILSSCCTEIDCNKAIMHIILLWFQVRTATWSVMQRDVCLPYTKLWVVDSCLYTCIIRGTSSAIKCIN